MSAAGVVRVYRLAVRLYPRSFREEYGDDLVRLLADQLRDEGTPRVLARTTVDVLLSVPQRHLEAHMPVTPSSFLSVLFGASALAAVVVGVVIGHPAVLAGCLAAGLGLGGLSLLAAHRARPLSDGRSSSSRWWMALSAGIVLLAGLVIATSITGELSSVGWVIAMVLGLTSLLLIGAGATLGIMHLASRGPRAAPTL